MDANDSFNHLSRALCTHYLGIFWCESSLEVGSAPQVLLALGLHRTGGVEVLGRWQSTSIGATMAMAGGDLRGRGLLSAEIEVAEEDLIRRMGRSNMLSTCECVVSLCELQIDTLKQVRVADRSSLRPVLQAVMKADSLREANRLLNRVRAGGERIDRERIVSRWSRALLTRGEWFKLGRSKQRMMRIGEAAAASFRGRLQRLSPTFTSTVDYDVALAYKLSRLEKPISQSSKVALLA